MIYDQLKQAEENKTNREETEKLPENACVYESQTEAVCEDWIKEHVRMYGVEPNLFDGA